MKIQVGYAHGAYVCFDDEGRKGQIPTPELIEDITRRIERSVVRMNLGAPLDDAAIEQADTD